MQETNNITEVALVALVVMSYLTWSLPRRFAVCPLLAMTCLMPLGQKLDLLGVDFHLFRILLLVGFVRVVAKGEFGRLRLTRLDKVLLWWACVSVVFGTLSKPSFGLLANRLGHAYDALLCYFFFRSAILDFEDILVSVRALALLTLPLAGLMLVERTTMHNPLAIFGGVPEAPLLRNGEVRCFGAFRQPILAGTFGATQIPLFVGLWHYGPRHRRLAAVATVASLLIVFLARSSGPLLACAAGFAGLILWKWRSCMPFVRWGAAVAIVGLAMIMEAPVWYLFAKLGNLTGGGGWHRAYLIDTAVEHFAEWWLFGTTYTAHWGPAGEVIAANPNMMDITNQYIHEGVEGGLLKMVLFVAVIVVCFRIVGRKLQTNPAGDPAGMLVWCLGVSLFAHALSFTSVPYFDQIIVIWYWLLAVICAAGSIRVHVRASQPVVDSEAAPIDPNGFPARS